MTVNIIGLSVDLDGLLATYGAVAPITVAFRAHYVTGGGSDKVATHFSAAVDLVINPSSSCGAPGVTVGATLASGDGSPAPGASGPWTFRISVTNCTGVNLTGVKVQVGTSASSGSVVIRGNNRNQVLTWTVDIADGATVTLDVTVDGTIPASAPDGQIRYLSGAWSAVYNDGSGAAEIGLQRSGIHYRHRTAVDPPLRMKTVGALLGPPLLFCAGRSCFRFQIASKSAIGYIRSTFPFCSSNTVATS